MSNCPDCGNFTVPFEGEQVCPLVSMGCCPPSTLETPPPPSPPLWLRAWNGLERLLTFCVFIVAIVIEVLWSYRWGALWLVVGLVFACRFAWRSIVG